MMDANENLNEQRRLCKSILDGIVGIKEAEVMQDAARLVDLVETLDDHLCHGGAIPDEWGGDYRPAAGTLQERLVDAIGEALGVDTGVVSESKMSNAVKAASSIVGAFAERLLESVNR